MAWSDAPTFTTGQVVTAAQLNTLGGDLNVIGQTWPPYTPAWTAGTTNPAIGNGSLGASAMIAGKTVLYRIVLQPGSTTTFGAGTYGFSFPVSANVNYGEPVGRANVYDGTTHHPCLALAQSATTFFLVTCSGNAYVTPTVPVTLTSSCTITISGTYEGA